MNVTVVLGLVPLFLEVNIRSRRQYLLHRLSVPVLTGVPMATIIVGLYLDPKSWFFPMSKRVDKLPIACVRSREHGLKSFCEKQVEESRFPMSR